jgi:hypothetical protein
MAEDTDVHSDNLQLEKALFVGALSAAEMRFEVGKPSDLTGEPLRH